MTIQYHTYAANQSAEQYVDAVFDLASYCYACEAAPFLYRTSKASYLEYLAQDYLKVLAFDGHDLVGFGLVRLIKTWPHYFDFLPQPSGRCALLHSILVHPDYRGKGIGKALTLKRMAAIAQEKVEHVYATVHPDNTASFNNLDRLGFAVIAKRPLFEQQLMRLVMYSQHNACWLRS